MLIASYQFNNDHSNNLNSYFKDLNEYIISQENNDFPPFNCNYHDLESLPFSKINKETNFPYS